MATRNRNVLNVRIVTADRELYNGEADLVSAPGSEGQLGILPEHAPLLTTLKTGELRIRHGENEEPIFVSSGFLEVSNNNVAILADTAERAEEIDEARAQAARRRAEDLLAQAQTNVERTELQGALERAITRLRIVETAQRRGRRRVDVQTPRNE
jgi:F-type H+-transporting ATPase subunit epsilon